MRLRSLHNTEIGSGATIEQISSAEEKLFARFPQSYVQFLLSVGWVDGPNIVIYGLGRDVPTQLNLVNNTICERNECEPAVPGYAIPVMNDGSGNNFCLDCRAFLDEECCVVFWDHEHELGRKQVPEIVALDFFTWVQNTIAEAEQMDSGN